MAYEMHCTNCMRKWIIDDPAFDQLVQSIEESAGKMFEILRSNNVPAAYKSHCHVFPVIDLLMRCCAEPEISLVNRDDLCPEPTPPDPLATIAADRMNEFIQIFRTDTPPDPHTTIVADLRTLTARVSEVETTANPTAAAALSEAPGCGGGRTGAGGNGVDGRHGSGGGTGGRRMTTNVAEDEEEVRIDPVLSFDASLICKRCWVRLQKERKAQAEQGADV